MQHTPTTIEPMLTNPRFVSPSDFATRERTVSSIERRGSDLSTRLLVHTQVPTPVPTKERWLRCALIVLVLFLGSIPRANAQSAKPVEVREVKLSAPSETTARVSIATTAEPRFVARVANGGKQLVIEISGADLKGSPGVTHGNTMVSRVSSQTLTQDDVKIARFNIDLARNAEYRISTSPTGLVLDLSAADTTKPIVALVPDAAPSTAGQTATIAVTNVKFDHQPGKDRVIIELDADAKFSPRNDAERTNRHRASGRTVARFART